MFPWQGVSISDSSLCFKLHVLGRDGVKLQASSSKTLSVLAKICKHLIIYTESFSAVESLG